MTKQNARTNETLGTVVAVTAVLLIAVLLPSVTQAAPPELPPRPTPLTPPPLPPRPGSTPVPTPPSRWEAGGPIELRAEFTDERLWTRVHWQDLWTVVQWQDERGVWHDVESWQGSLDEISGNVGSKTWWAAKSDLAKGPFRWMVYQGKGGRLLEQSSVFYLPGFVGERVVVEVMCGL